MGMPHSSGTALERAVRRLVDTGDPAGAATRLESGLLPLVAAGRDDLVRSLVEQVPAAHRGPLALVALADAQLRQGVADPLGLEAIPATVTAAGRPDLVCWARALRAEQLLLAGDLMAFPLAAQWLAEAPAEPLPPSHVLQARARLRRIVAVAQILDQPADHQELTTAQSELVRAGWQTERWLTVALRFFIRIALAGEVTTDSRLALVEARDQLLACGSPQALLARHAVLFGAFAWGDEAGVQAELAQIRRSPAGRLPAARLLAEHFGLILEFRAGGAPDRLRSSLDQLRTVAPYLTGPVLAITTHELLDAGAPDEAAAWLGRLEALPVLLPHEALDRDTMRHRLAIQRGHGDPGALAATLDELVTAGYRRTAGSLAARTITDAHRAGADGLAAVLRRRAERDLPPAPERSTWEAARLAVGGCADVPPRGTISVLAPSMGVTVDGRQRPLPDHLARLLAFLTLRDRLVGVEELGAQLWPDAGPETVRRRLKVALHRLRAALGLRPGELVHRRGDAVGLVPGGGWRVDLHEYHRHRAGDGADRLAALRMVGGLLLDAQFPYEDTLARERAVLSGGWLALAQELLAQGLAGVGEITRRATSLGLAAELEFCLAAPVSGPR